ncbi:MAG: hypothetical protein SPJ62_06360 [Inconstantimicrobium porci]|uniref:hypothetical protein n=1 Tax=Inconstantimicrobium porci TaxID=2652291 RepID=UPI002A908A15|nr:hypothetical protein [Inconstantimicrobium porci]MDY5911622.1 hypothetical protein [Inconstantimicrobium porci]
MKRKFITIALLCTMSITLLGCNNDKKDSTVNNKDNQTQQSNESNKKNNISENNDDFGKSENTGTPIDASQSENTSEKVTPMTSEQMVEKYNEIYPKMYTFFKEKLEKPYINRGDEYAIKLKKDEIKVSGYKGISGLSYGPDQNNDKEFVDADFNLAVDPDNRQKIVSLGGNLNQRYNLDELIKNGYKLQGTLFEEFINTLSTEKVDIAELEKEASKEPLQGVTKRYGNTVISVNPNAGDLRVTIMIC